MGTAGFYALGATMGPLRTETPPKKEQTKQGISKSSGSELSKLGKLFFEFVIGAPSRSGFSSSSCVAKKIERSYPRQEKNMPKKKDLVSVMQSTPIRKEAPKQEDPMEKPDGSFGGKIMGFLEIACDYLPQPGMIAEAHEATMRDATYDTFSQ